MSQITAVIPTLNAARHLPRCVSHLADGIGQENGPRIRVVVADGGSSDDTVAVARELGARVVVCPRGRGVQLATGARNVIDTDPHCEWLLFVHADTALAPGWREAADAFIARTISSNTAAVFRFALDDDSAAARRLTAMVHWRVRRLGLPYGDQGLLIHRHFYEAIGGYKPLPLMEDVAIIERIGRQRFVMLEADAVTSAERWRREGWTRRSAKNVICLGLYYAGLPASWIARIYS
ncbi:MAG: glycosyltransferase [Verrucomicrobiae bacterium]|nr:glycosyltransferase [Verrucomicrobiae bacterium]